MSNRSLDALLPEVRVKVESFLAAALKQGLDLKVICTYRSPEEQDALFAQGRTTPGRIVTRSRAWESWHQTRRAADLVPLDGQGNIRWDWPPATWQLFGKIAKSCGLTWGGDFPHFPDLDHVEDRAGLTLQEAHKALAGQPWPPVPQTEPAGSLETSQPSLPTDKLTPL